MNRSILLLILIMVYGCIVPDMTPEKKMFAVLDFGSVTVEWYSRSSAYANTPDFVVAENDEKIDTICMATNVSGIRKGKRNELVLVFKGVPKKYESVIWVASKALSLGVLVDTSGK